MTKNRMPILLLLRPLQQRTEHTSKKPCHLSRCEVSQLGLALKKEKHASARTTESNAKWSDRVSLKFEQIYVTDSITEYFWVFFLGAQNIAVS